jgi:hypothetical protein
MNAKPLASLLIGVAVALLSTSAFAEKLPAGLNVVAIEAAPTCSGPRHRHRGVPVWMRPLPHLPLSPAACERL